MPKAKGKGRGRKRTPNVDINYSENEQNEQKDLQKTNVKSSFASFQILRKKTLEYIGGNQMPQNFSFREKQVKEIRSYIDDCFSKQNKNKYRILMVTGSPGAGKSLSVNHILTKMQKKSVKIIKFNANLIKTVRDAQQIICQQILELKYGGQMSTLQIIRALQQLKNKQKYIIYIQEVEVILEQKTNIFTQDFFCLFSNPKISIMLLGISNTIDAMVKYSKSISVNLNQIKNIVFQPYTHQNIVGIMKEKLNIIENQYSFKIIIPDKVFNFIAAKIQNLKKGDVRIVLQFLKELIASVIPKNVEDSIGIKQEGYIVNLSMAQGVFSKMKSPHNDVISTLPHTQKMVLIAIYLHIKQNDCLYMNKKQAQQKTKWVCDSLGLQFHVKMVQDGIEQLQQYCLISRNKKGNEERIMLKISLNQVQVTMEDHQLFKKFFKQQK